MKKLFLAATLVVLAIVIYAFRPGSNDIINVKAVDLSNFDTKTRPQDDFYQFVNGNWIKNNPVPASEARWGAFSEVTENNYKVLHKVLESAAANKSAVKGSNEQKIGDFYATGMDSIKLEKDGMKPLRADMDRIIAIKTMDDVISAIAFYTNYFSNPVFSFYATLDAKNSTAVVPYANQGGLSLPDKDYYLKDDDKSKHIREEYQKHIIKVFQLAGDKENDSKAATKVVMTIETEFAQVSLSRIERRNPEKTYNKFTIKELNDLTPGFNWTNFLPAVGVANSEYLIIDNPEFFKTLGKMLQQHTVEEWKTFLRWNILSGAAPYLSSEWVMENFNFNDQVLKGTKEIKPRWKRVLATVDGSVGEALGQLYCDQAFTPETKKHCLEMVNNLGFALNERISKLDWMSGETKEKAKAKLGMFMKKIGYPDKWIDYSTLNIDLTSYYNNVTQATSFGYKRMINKIGKPVERGDWNMSPPTVNAYYNPSLNEIVFPAGILQPPFYNPNADDAINYGGIGAVIGHEMTHGFDDQGRQFDASGNLSNWWNAEDSAKFMTKANMIVKQFNNSTVLDTMHINGQLTLGENIADLGGLTIAFEAFKKSLEGKPATEKIDGFTAQQRFFIGWAQVWRQNVRDEELRRRLIVDPHSPGKLRCNKPLVNMPDFYEAFGVKPGDKMYRDENDRAKIW